MTDDTLKLRAEQYNTQQWQLAIERASECASDKEAKRMRSRSRSMTHPTLDRSFDPSLIRSRCCCIDLDLENDRR